MASKSGNGVYWRKKEGALVFYWRIGKITSKDFHNKRECAVDFVTKFIEKNPKYEEIVCDKTWDEIFRIFGIEA